MTKTLVLLLSLLGLCAVLSAQPTVVVMMQTNNPGAFVPGLPTIPMPADQIKWGVILAACSPDPAVKGFVASTQYRTPGEAQVKLVSLFFVRQPYGCGADLSWIGKVELVGAPAVMEITGIGRSSEPAPATAAQ